MRFKRILGISASLTIAMPLQLATLFILAPQALAATSTYNETFGSTTYKDGGATTADWNTGLGALQSPAGLGNYYKVDEATLGRDNVSNTDPGLSTSRSLALDSSGRPVIAWDDSVPSGTNFEILVTRWDGSSWVKPSDGTAGYDNISNNAQNSRHPSLTLDALDRPLVAWDDVTPGNAEILVSRLIGSSWVKPSDGTAGYDNISNNGTTSAYTSVAIDSSDNPVVTWTDDNQGSLQVAHLSGSIPAATWSGYYGAGFDTIKLGAGVGTVLNPVVAVNASDYPAIAWQDISDGDFDTLVTQWTGATYTGFYNGNVDLDNATFENDNVSANANDSVTPRLVFDSSGKPVVAWNDWNNLGFFQVFISHWTGSTYTGYYNGNTDLDNSTFEFDVIDQNLVGGGYKVSLVTDSLDRPIVAWDDDSFGDEIVILSRWNGSTWTGANSTDPDGDSSTFDYDNIGNTGSGVSQFASVAVDAADRPAIAWDDTADIFFTRWLPNYGSPAVGQSLAVDTTTSNITDATLTATETLNGGTTAYSLSNDGGTTWESVISGTPHTFTSTGSDLRWKVDITAEVNARQTPTIESLVISYSYIPPVAPTPTPTPDPVTRIGGDTAAQQSINVSKTRFADHTAAAAVLARDGIIVDAFAGTPLATALNATLLLTPTGQLDSAVLTELQRATVNTSASVYLLGGNQALDPQIEAALTNAGYGNVVRLDGANRRATAATIAREIIKSGKASTTFEVTEDQRLVDALGVGALAGDVSDGTVNPILLTVRGSATLDANTDALVRDNPSFRTVEIVGGVNAVSDEVLSTLSAMSNISSVERVAGASRYDTNLALAVKHRTAPTSVVVASGERNAIPGAASVGATYKTLSGEAFFYATLLAGVLAADDQAPLLIVQSNTMPQSTQDYIISHASTITSATIVGTLVQVSQAVQDLLEQIIQ